MSEIPRSLGNTYHNIQINRNGPVLLSKSIGQTAGQAFLVSSSAPALVQTHLRFNARPGRGSDYISLAVSFLTMVGLSLGCQKKTYCRWEIYCVWLILTAINLTWPISLLYTWVITEVIGLEDLRIQTLGQIPLVKRSDPLFASTQNGHARPWYPRYLDIIHLSGVF